MVMRSDELAALIAAGRVTVPAAVGDSRLGDLGQLPGTWTNASPGSGFPDFAHHGWNLIALPHRDAPNGFMLLVNQFDEQLTFGPNVTGPVANRGRLADQRIFALEYQQAITQFAAQVEPPAATANDPPTAAGVAIHLEPGLLLNFAVEVDPNFSIARQASIPHGDCVLAIGSARRFPGAPDLASAIATIGLPIGTVTDIDDPYLAPYNTLEQKPFQGIFSAVHPAKLLAGVVPTASVQTTTMLDFNTDHPTSGIVNVPFVTSQANAVSMHATFWIQQLFPKAGQPPVVVLQYLQIVLLEFFARTDGHSGLIRWPHVSINTLVRNP